MSGEETMSKNIQLKDFIYIDVPRMESFLAQLQRGLVKEIVESTSGQKGIGAELGGGIPLLQARLTGSSGITRAQETSKILHDYLYTMLEREIGDHVIETAQAFSLDDWQSGIVHRQLGEKQTDFIRTKGRVRILDFASMGLQLETIARIMESFSRVQSASFKATQAMPGSVKSRQQRGQKPSKKKGDDEWTQFIALIKEFYGDLIILKVYPIPGNDVYCFVGTLDKSYLQEERAQMLFKFGTSPTVDWTVFAQVASVPRRIQQTQGLQFPDLPRLSPDQFTDFSEMITSMIEIIGTAFVQTGFTMSVKYPAISITPLAVYRTAD
jgi:hypothetical protein